MSSLFRDCLSYEAADLNLTRQSAGRPPLFLPAAAAREGAFACKGISAVKNRGGTFPVMFTRREITKRPRLTRDPFTSQVMTSSDLLPPPPLTFAGATSGTAEETGNASRRVGAGSGGLAEGAPSNKHCPPRAAAERPRGRKHHLRRRGGPSEWLLVPFPVRQGPVLCEAVAPALGSVPSGRAPGGLGRRSLTPWWHTGGAHAQPGRAPSLTGRGRHTQSGR